MNLYPRSKRALAALLLLALLFTGAPALAGDIDDTRTGTPPLIDLVLIRPVLLVTGTVATVAWAPFVGIPCAITGQFETAGKAFVAGPGKVFARTFLVPLGY